MSKAKPKLKRRAGSLDRIVLLRGLRARKAHARMRQKHKLCNDNGWLYNQGMISILNELITLYEQENARTERPGQ